MFNVQRPHANNTKHAAEPCTLTNPAPWPQLDWQSIDLNITWLARAVVCMQPWMLHCVSTVFMCSGTTRSCQIHTFHITVDCTTNCVMGLHVCNENSKKYLSKPTSSHLLYVLQLVSFELLFCVCYSHDKNTKCTSDTNIFPSTSRS